MAQEKYGTAEIAAMAKETAKTLATKLMWIEPLKLQYQGEQTVIGIIEGGTMHTLGVALLTGHMRLEAGQEEYAHLQVQRKNTLHLFAVERPKLSAEHVALFTWVLEQTRARLGCPKEVGVVRERVPVDQDKDDTRIPVPPLQTCLWVWQYNDEAEANLKKCMAY